MTEASEYVFDLHQIFLGDFSAMIYLEIALRVFVIMAYTMLIIRWIGKRAVGGLGSADVLLIVAMGSAVGDAMFYPSIPISVSLTTVTVIAILQKIYVYLGVKNDNLRELKDPKVVKLVENGELLEDNFTKDVIDKHEVYMLLRQQGVRYLSEVDCAYYEQSGSLSVFKFDNPILENSILPEDTGDLK